MAASLAALLPLAWSAPAQVTLEMRRATGRNGAIATAAPCASEAGLEILKAGGNAFDAAAAAAFAVAVVEPFGSSLGGDGNCILHTAATAKTEHIDFRCVAPAAASYSNYDYSKVGSWKATGKGPAVPGMVAGVIRMHTGRGKLPLSRVLEPAIRLAEQGFKVEKTLAAVIQDRFSDLDSHKPAAAIFLPNGLPPEVGDTLRNPDLGRTLRVIAAKGFDGFYRGDIAQRIVDFLKAEGGIMTAEDLAAYTAQNKTPLHITYRGYDVLSAPAPWGGLVVLSNLKTIERLPLDISKGAGDPRNMHYVIDTMRHTSRDVYGLIGDPTFVRLPEAEYLADDKVAARVRSILANESLRQDAADVTAPGSSTDSGNTTHLSVIDRDGNAVALTQTLGSFFGSFEVPPGTGVVLNDQMKNFSGKKESPNSLQPHKRMRSTQAPTLLLRNGKVVVALGSPGNYQIITTVTEVVMNLLDYHMDLFSAVDAPRFSASAADPDVHLEGRFTSSSLTGLESHGHHLRVYREFDLYFGGVQAAIRDLTTGVMGSAADRRRDGTAVAF